MVSITHNIFYLQHKFRIFLSIHIPFLAFFQKYFPTLIFKYYCIIYYKAIFFLLHLRNYYLTFKRSSSNITLWWVSLNQCLSVALKCYISTTESLPQTVNLECMDLPLIYSNIFMSYHLSWHTADKQSRLLHCPFFFPPRRVFYTISREQNTNLRN